MSDDNPLIESYNKTCDYLNWWLDNPGEMPLAEGNRLKHVRKFMNEAFRPLPERVLSLVKSSIQSRAWGFSVTTVFDPENGDVPVVTGGYDATVSIADSEGYVERAFGCPGRTELEAVAGAFAFALGMPIPSFGLEES